MSGAVDSHQHYWRIADPEQSRRRVEEPQIARDYLPADLHPELDRAGVGSTVLVQSVTSDRENYRMRELAAAPGSRVAGVVGWVPLGEPDEALALLDGAAGEPPVRGVRDLHGRGDLSFVLEPGPQRVLAELDRRGLTWDVVPVDHEQRQVVASVARALPGLRIVVDHLGRPPVPDRGWEPWAGDLRDLAGLPNVCCKLSVGIDVLAVWDRWRGEDLDRYVRWAVEVFGPDRVMWASNWPVALLATTYAETQAAVARPLERLGLTDDERAAVLGGTATRWYRLGPEPGSGPA